MVVLYVLIDTRETGLQGYEILDALSKRYGKDVEKATLGSVLFLFGTQHIDTWPEIVRDLADIINGSGRLGQRFSNYPRPAIQRIVSARGGEYSKRAQI